MTDSTYHGWKNYETWNVALWIQNDENFYQIAQQCDNYTQWVRNICDGFTPDGVNYFAKDLDIPALSEMILEL